MPSKADDAKTALTEVPPFRRAPAVPLSGFAIGCSLLAFGILTLASTAQAGGGLGSGGFEEGDGAAAASWTYTDVDAGGQPQPNAAERDCTFAAVGSCSLKLRHAPFGSFASQFVAYDGPAGVRASADLLLYNPEGGSAGGKWFTAYVQARNETGAEIRGHEEHVWSTEPLTSWTRLSTPELILPEGTAFIRVAVHTRNGNGGADYDSWVDDVRLKIAWSPQTGPGPTADLLPVCAESREDFTSDVFAAERSPWTRSDLSVTAGEGLLRVAPDGSYGSYAIRECLMASPISIDVRARLVSAGQGYVFPWLFFDLLDGRQFVTIPLPGANHGWRLQICPDWLTDCPDDGWTGSIPHPIASEGQFMTVRVAFSETRISVYSRLADSSEFQLAGTLDASVGAVRSIGIGQPWDPRMEIEYVSTHLIESAAAGLSEAAEAVAAEGIRAGFRERVTGPGQHVRLGGGETPPVAPGDPSTPAIAAQPLGTQEIVVPRYCAPFGCFGGAEVPSQDLGSTPAVESRTVRGPRLDPQTIPTMGAHAEPGPMDVGVGLWVGLSTVAPIPLHADATPLVMADGTICPSGCPAPDASIDPPTITPGSSTLGANVEDLSVEHET